MKVALCFIISYQHKLNKEKLWINWIEKNKDIINVYFHYKDYNLIKSNWIKKHCIPPKLIQKTSYYDVVPAYMSILSFAFEHDKENKWFILLTDSCVPIISPEKFRYLFYKNYYNSIIRIRPSFWNIDIHQRANLKYLNSIYHLTNDPWFLLTRNHVHKCMIFIALKNNIYQLVVSGGLANESIFAIMLKSFNLVQVIKNNDDEKIKYEKNLYNLNHNIINELSTIADWTRMSNPTSPFLFKENNKENIKIIEDLIKTNKYSLFLRKVDSNFPDNIITSFYYKDYNYNYYYFYYYYFSKLYNNIKKYFTNIVNIYQKFWKK